jgi:hypothetical protein
MRKRLVFVLGPESCGTRGTTRFLIKNGDYFGTDEHIQPLDSFVLAHKPIQQLVPQDIQNVVFRRSIPHAGGYPDLNMIDTSFLNAGFKTTWVVVIRDLAEIVRSKISRGHAVDEMSAWMDTIYQYNWIFERVKFKTSGVYFFPFTLHIKQPQVAIDILKSFKIL